MKNFNSIRINKFAGYYFISYSFNKLAVYIRYLAVNNKLLQA